MRDSSFMRLVRLLPKSVFSSAVGLATRLPAPASLHRLAMRAFARRYRVALEEAEHSLDAYPTFSDFFSRGLKPGLRPVEGGETVVVSPVDGRVSQGGMLERGRCLQAKGIDFPVADLLGDAQEARRFEDGGAFLTLYLAPRDYHRIHAPLGGTVTGFRYLPGELWPVNPISVRNKSALFCLNERLVTWLDTAVGTCAVVKVGATCVARIRTSYDDVLTHSGGGPRTQAYVPPRPIAKGEELGRFEMGSTVILLFEPDRVRWDAGVAPEAAVRMGRRIGQGR